jgi:methylphosphotriester-DNA--protein-cysteine methyltransferase
MARDHHALHFTGSFINLRDARIAVVALHGVVLKIAITTVNLDGVRADFLSQSMRRRLKQEGYTYQSIKDDLRRDIAIDELQDTGRTIADIATSVGFAEPGAFHRAFRKWIGMRPTDYRPARADFTHRAESD